MTTNELLIENQGLLKKMANEWMAMYKLPESEFEDLVMAGNVGFLKAFEFRTWDEQYPLSMFVKGHVRAELARHTGEVWPGWVIPKDIISGSRRSRTGETWADLGIEERATSLDGMRGEIPVDGGIPAVEATVTADQSVAALVAALPAGHAATLRLWLEHDGDVQAMARAAGTKPKSMHMRVQRALTMAKKDVDIRHVSG